MQSPQQARRSSPQFQRIKSKIDDLEAKLSKNWELEGQLNQRCDELSKERESLIAHLKASEVNSRQPIAIDNNANMKNIYAENQNLIRLNRELTAELKHLQKISLNNVESQKNSQVLNETIKILKDSLDHEKENNKKLVDELVKLKKDSRVSKLKAENTVQKHTIIKTMKKLEKSQQLYAQALNTISEKDKIIQQLQKQKAKLEKQNNGSTDNESDSEGLREEVEELREQIGFLTEENELLRQHQIEMINQHLKNAHESLESVKSDSKDFQNKLLALDSLKHENELLRHQLFSLSYSQGKNAQEMVDELSQIRDTCQKLQDRVEQYEKDENTLRNEEQKEQNKGEKLNNSTSAENQELLEILKNHSSQLKENTETIELQKKAIDALKNEIKNLRSENIKLMNPDSDEPINVEDDFPDDFIDIDHDADFWIDKCQYLKARIRKLEKEAYVNSKVHRNSSGDSCTDFSEENKSENEQENKDPDEKEEYDTIEDAEETVEADPEPQPPKIEYKEPKFISEGEIIDISEVIDDDDDPNFVISSTDEEPIVIPDSSDESPSTRPKLSPFNYEAPEEGYLEKEIAELQERVDYVSQLINNSEIRASKIQESSLLDTATSPAKK